jgi:hypothetical protein
MSEARMEQNNGDFSVKECRAVMKYLFLKGNLAKKNMFLPTPWPTTGFLGLEQVI